MTLYIAETIWNRTLLWMKFCNFCAVESKFNRLLSFVTIYNFDRKCVSISSVLSLTSFACIFVSIFDAEKRMFDIKSKFFNGVKLQQSLFENFSVKFVLSFKARCSAFKVFNQFSKIFKKWIWNLRIIFIVWLIRSKMSFVCKW